MTSLSPKEVEIVLDWGKEELVKSFKVPAAFDIFKACVQNGEINIPTISRKLLVKLAFKLGAKNGQFLTRLQKFIKTLQKEGADSINIQEHKEIYQINLREKKDNIKGDGGVIEQETHTITAVEPNQHGATQISKTVFSSGNNNDQKTILVTVSFDDDKTKENDENPENQEKGQTKIEKKSNDTEKNDRKEENSNDNNDSSIYRPDIDKDSESSDANTDAEDNTENMEPQDPNQQFLEAHKKFLYAREEARFKINQKINYNINTPKVTFQPRGWQTLFTLTKSSSEDEEEEVEELETVNILVDDATPFQSMQKQNQNNHDDSYSDDETKKRRHHKHRRRRH